MCVEHQKIKIEGKDIGEKAPNVHGRGRPPKTADGNESASSGEQIIPALQGFRDWMMPNELWKERIKCAVQFRGHNSLEFAQSIPEFDAGIVLHIPGFPRDVGFMEGRRFGIAWMGDKTNPSGITDAINKRLRVVS